MFTLRGAVTLKRLTDTALDRLTRRSHHTKHFSLSPLHSAAWQTRNQSKACHAVRVLMKRLHIFDFSLHFDASQMGQTFAVFLLSHFSFVWFSFSTAHLCYCVTKCTGKMCTRMKSIRECCWWIKSKSSWTEFSVSSFWSVFKLIYEPARKNSTQNRKFESIKLGRRSNCVFLKFFWMEKINSSLTKQSIANLRLTTVYAVTIIVCTKIDMIHAGLLLGNDFILHTTFETTFWFLFIANWLADIQRSCADSSVKKTSIYKIFHQATH